MVNTAFKIGFSNVVSDSDPEVSFHYKNNGQDEVKLEHLPKKPAVNG